MLYAAFQRAAPAVRVQHRRVRAQLGRQPAGRWLVAFRGRQLAGVHLCPMTMRGN